MVYEFRGNTGMLQQGSEGRAGRTARRSLAQVLALVFGVTFLLVGIAGFIPGVTDRYDELSGLGTDSHAELLGLFRVSVLHNIVHILFGVGILASVREDWSLTYLLGGGVAYLGVAVYGALVDHDSDANFLPINTADTVLHTVLALALIGAGVIALAASRRATATPATPAQ